MIPKWLNVAEIFSQNSFDSSKLGQLWCKNKESSLDRKSSAASSSQSCESPKELNLVLSSPPQSPREEEEP